MPSAEVWGICAKINFAIATFFRNAVRSSAAMASIAKSIYTARSFGPFGVATWRDYVSNIKCKRQNQPSIQLLVGSYIGGVTMGAGGGESGFLGSSRGAAFGLRIS